MHVRSYYETFPTIPFILSLSPSVALGIPSSTNMKVFISWSGSQSRALAEVLRQWLPAVIQAVQPYYSPDDVTKGARWSEEIAKVLEESRVGLICLTRNNLDAPWIMFEAGALSKKLDKSRVSPILFGVEPTDLTGPLVQFQAAKFDKVDVKRLVRMINAELGDARLATDVLDTVFEMWWPKLEEQVETVLEAAVDARGVTVRPQRELLEEILLLARSQARAPSATTVHPQVVNDLIECYARLVDHSCERNTIHELAPTFEALQRPLSYLLTNLRHQSGKSAKNPVAQFQAVNEQIATATASPGDAPILSEEDDDLPF